MSRAQTLYTPEVLALATGLAGFPLEDGLPLRGASRSPTCGSTIELGLALGPDGRIVRVGVKAHACAIGQAAAAIFAAGAPGCDQDQLAASLAALESWLGGESAIPSWPGLAAVVAARDFPARHGAMLLAWKAAVTALSTCPAPR